MKLKLRQNLNRLTHKTLVEKMFHHSFDVENHAWYFSLGDSIEEIINSPRNKHLLSSLAEPAGFTNVLLHKSKAFALLNFTDLTVFDVLQRLVKFYSHKTTKRMLGGADTTFCGFEKVNNSDSIRSVLINHF